MLPGITWAGQFLDGVQINNGGQIALGGRIEGLDVDQSNNEVIVRITSGIPTVIARKGEVAPGSGGQTFGDLSADSVLINDDGEVFFKALLSDDTSGLWQARPEAINAIAIEGRPFSTIPNVVWDFTRRIGLGPGNQLVIEGGSRIDGGVPLSSGIYLINPDGSTPLIEFIVGRTLPDEPEKHFASYFYPKVNGHSEFMVGATISDENGLPLDERRAYAGTRDTLINLTPSGFAAESFGLDYVVSSIYPTGITSGGAEVFGAYLRIDDILSTATFLRHADGALVAVAASGQAIRLGGELVEVVHTENIFGTINNSLEIPLVIQTRAHGIYLAIARDVPEIASDSTVPTLDIQGRRKIFAPRKRFPVRGTTTDETALDRVEIKIRGQSFRPVRGTDRWKQRVRLRPGRNRILVRAVDSAGNVSARAKQILVRRANN